MFIVRCAPIVKYAKTPEFKLRTCPGVYSTLYVYPLTLLHSRSGISIVANSHDDRIKDVGRMRTSNGSCLFLRLSFSVLLLLCVISNHLTLSKDSVKAIVKIDGSNDDKIEFNPNYQFTNNENNSDNDDENDDDDDDDDNEDDDDNDENENDENENEEEKILKSILKSTSKKAMTKAFKSSRNSPQRAIKLLQQHRGKITVALVVFAFRRELYQAMMHICGTPKIDPNTGKEISRHISFSITAILKIAIFLHFVMQWQQGKFTPTWIIAILAGPNGLLLTRIISRFLQPADHLNAYIPPIEQHWTFERLNERYDKDISAYRKAMTTIGSLQIQTHPPTETYSNTDPATDTTPKTLQKILESLLKSITMPVSTLPYNKTAIVVDMTGLDSSVTTLSVIRDQVSFLIHTHQSRRNTIITSGNNRTIINDAEANVIITNHTDTTTINNTILEFPETEIIILLESPGGEVAAYGMAAQQIIRLRNEPGIIVTICVDKVAASGGYMIACCASKGHLFAAPFATLGSIGVFGSIVNINDALLRWGVKPIVLKAGKNKAPLGLIGAVTEEGKANVQSIIDKTHLAFKRHVATVRPILQESIHEIATGDIWLGHDALEVDLVDRLTSSDEYIAERMSESVRVLRLVKNVPKWRFGSPSSSRFPFATLICQGYNSIAAHIFQAFASQSLVDGMPLLKSHAATNIQVKTSQL